MRPAGIYPQRLRANDSLRQGLVEPILKDASVCRRVTRLSWILGNGEADGLTRDLRSGGEKIG